MTKVAREVFLTIRKYNLFIYGDKVVIGVSGGCDSVALLHILLEIRKILNLTLYIAHLNHQLRTEGDEEERFVVKIAKDLNIPVETKKVDVRFFAKKNRLNLEDSARKIRYDFFTEVCKKYKCKKIATAHNATDFVETVLMKFIKGSGGFGLTGIPIKRELAKNIEVVRPLLKIPKDKIKNYCRQKKIKYKIDITNKDTNFLRNNIRLKILPRLESINKNFTSSILKNAEIYSAEDRYFKNILNNIYYDIIKKNKNKIFLNLEKFKMQDVAIQRRLIKKILETEAKLSRLTFENIEDVIALADKETGKKIIFQKILVKKEKNRIVFYKEK